MDRLLTPRGVARLALRTALLVAPLVFVAPGPLEAGNYAGQRTSEAGPTIVQSVWQSGGELVSQLVNCPANYIPILTVTIPTVSAGQTFSIAGDMEATNNYTTINPMLASYLTVNGKGVDNPEASNISPDQHHMAVTRAAFWQAKSNMQNVVVQLVARACDEGLTTNQVALQVNYGYGTVFVKVN
jgi:hypothetical protein